MIKTFCFKMHEVQSEICKVKAKVLFKSQIRQVSKDDKLYSSPASNPL